MDLSISYLPKGRIRAIPGREVSSWFPGARMETPCLLKEKDKLPINPISRSQIQGSSPKSWL